jgi:lipoyl(octanoyl) transferase
MIPVNIRSLGLQDYQSVWQAMRDFTTGRDQQTRSEIWLLEHPAVFTQGQAGKAEHVLNSGNIPVVQSDRGGQVTYHAPGQLVVYLLLDLKTLNIGVRSLVTSLEQGVICLLRQHGICAESRKHAPGVYVDEKKIAALGLRVRRGYTYHGLALNLDLDLEPYSRINPCGYAGQQVTRLLDLGVNLNADEAGAELVDIFCAALNLKPLWIHND